VFCVAAFHDEPEYAEAFAAWDRRPGKVCLRARTEAQWRQVLEQPHALAGEPDGEAVVALPPRRRSQRGPLLERLQAMSTALEPPSARADRGDERDAMTYVLNPEAPMSSGKTVAQVAHAAVMAAAARTSLAGWPAGARGACWRRTRRRSRPPRARRAASRASSTPG
jgi:hypothetical protein